MTPTVVLIRGYPGSGKSTLAQQWAHRMGLVRLNRDDLRLGMFDKSWGLTWDEEKKVTGAQQSAARVLIAAGASIVVDDTNLKAKTARGWADLAAECGAVFEVRDVTTPVDVCVTRDADRAAAGGRCVGEDVIRDFATRYPMPWAPVVRTHRPAARRFAPYTPNPRLPRAILLDLDGTAALMGDRLPYDWARVGEDTPNEFVIDAAMATAERCNATLIAMSGRDSVCRQDTNEWLDVHVPTVDELYMRAAGDQRADDVVKAELFDRHIRDHFHVLGVFDDRDKVVAMWRAMGLTCLQVAPGAF